VVAAGAAMLIVGKLRKEEPGGPVALTPTLGPGLSGVGVAGEF
jgi:hypothetical protein